MELPLPPLRSNVRLSVEVVRELEARLGGDPVTEGYVLAYIGHRWCARTLFEVPARIATAALDRPESYLRAAKEFCEPELPF